MTNRATSEASIPSPIDANEGDSSFSASPFHRGEQRIQQRLGVREEIEPWARQVVHDRLPEQHRQFYAQLPFLVVAARDAEGHPWATLLTGEPGFAHSPDPRELVIGATPSAGDPLEGALGAGADIGVLGIESQTRRRNRVNGRVSARAADGFSLQVEQGFGNCPKYISERVARPVAASPRAAQVHRSASLSYAARRWIATADTLFIASGYRGRGDSATYGMDASHRGGPSGFVRVLDERTLAFDDYAGNNHYNTLGNLSLDPRASLLFVDFQRGGLLHLRGRARILWQGDQREVRFELDEVVERPHALALRWTQAQESPRELRVTSVQRESREVRSFLLQPDDGRPLEAFEAGQYLPVSLSIPGRDQADERTYSLSNSPGDDHYRISVKREDLGLVSRYLHDEIRVGDRIRTGAPRGTFVLDPSSARPAVLVSAGVGVTPMVAMLHALAAGESGARPVIFVHGARDGEHHSLREEVKGVVSRHANANLHVRYSRPGARDERGHDYHSTGRLDAALLEKLLPGLDADFYLCGPAAFLADLQRGLGKLGVPASRINTESF